MKVLDAGIYKVDAPLDVSLVPFDLNEPERSTSSKLVRPGRIRLVAIDAT